VPPLEEPLPPPEELAEPDEPDETAEPDDPDETAEPDDPDETAEPDEPDNEVEEPEELKTPEEPPPSGLASEEATLESPEPPQPAKAARPTAIDNAPNFRKADIRYLLPHARRHPLQGKAQTIPTESRDKACATSVPNLDKGQAIRTRSGPGAALLRLG
jgi:hypothetical protein